ncbi:TonB-dependent receptor [Sphingomonas bacterium]|uniref:TonB-dependent receptor n=1 Tax=Sphingomonas bacterium TaxID=1895847 RepID=UPI001575AC47|nr:TonB-dependent receptor [Sphingomonas bacterium]
MTAIDNKTRAGRCFLLASVAAIGLIGGTAAGAQSQGVPASDEAASGVIDQIVVTAQRRSESLQSVPLSVTALSGDVLRDKDVVNIDRLQQIAPGLRIGRSGSDPRPALRGTFTAAIQGNNDPRIGFYIDEIYQSRTSQLSVPFVDLEQIEVQKGPQGTLFGRNSFGGNIAITTAKPRGNFEAGLDATYGNYDRKLIQGFINIPVSKDLAVRFAGAFEDRDGYIKNIFNPKAEADDRHLFYIRSSLRFAPQALDGNLEILLHGSYWKEDDHGNGAFGSKAIGALYSPQYQIAPGGTLNLPNASPVTLPGGYVGLDYQSSTLIPYSVFYRDGIPDINGADVGIPIPGKYTLRTDYESVQKLKSKQFSANINYDIADVVRLRSITSYTDFSAFRTRDADGTSANKGIGYFLTEDKAFTQEFQIQSHKADSPLQYTAGLFYMKDKVPDAYFGLENRAYSTANAIATGGYPIYFNNYTYSSLVNYGAPLAGNVNSALVTAARSDSVNPLTYLETVSKAAYAQASYTFARKLTITGGLRYTEDHRTFFSALQLAAATGGTFAFSPGYGVTPSLDFNRTCDGFTAADPSSTATNKATALTTRCGDTKFKFWTYRLAADYKFDDQHMVYASYNTGRHAGGFSYSPRPGANTLNPVDTENVTAYEIGSKNQFFDRRLQFNVATFYNKYKNLQISVSYPNPLLAGSVSTYSQNGQSNDTYGAEFEMIAKPVRELTLNLAVNYLHARDNPVVVSGASSNSLCTIGTSASCPNIQIGLTGGILPNVVSNPELFVAVPGTTTFNTVGYNKKVKVQNQPDWTVQGGAAYTIDLVNAGKLTGEVQSYFNAGFLLSTSTPNFMQKSYTKTDLRLTYAPAGGRFTVQAFVENIENVAVVNRVTVSNYTYDGNYEAPRTYGLRVGFRY